MGNKLSEELKAFYDTELIENARCELFYAQFAKRQPLPLHHNGVVEWRKWNTFDSAVKLSVGVIPTGQKYGISTVVCHVIQHDSVARIDDSLEYNRYDDVILSATEECGAEAAYTQEKLIRDALMLGTNVLYCDNVSLATGETVSTPMSCSAMKSSTVRMSKLTPAMVNKAVTILKKNRVPRINGRYYAVIHPSVAHDLRQDDAWIEAHKYASPEELFNGEIGELHGVRFIEDAFAPVLGGEEYRSASDGVTYASFFFGKDAFGIIDPDGGALEMIIHDKDETDPPAEKTVIGYRFETNGATILYPERLLRVMSCSSFSNTDESNITTCEEKYIDSDEDAGNVKVYFERSEREDPNVFVGINGVNYLIPKGKASYIPPAVDREINRANRAGIVFNGLMDLLNNG